MNLLGAKNYDPVGGAVSKVTTSLLAMTAFDTTNLRIAFTVPAHGMVHVRMSGVHHGSTTTAQLFLGCLESATLRGRASPTPNLLGTAIATTRTKLEVSYTITGLTPGAATWDAAYGVEIVSSAGGAIKYGGPNDTTTDNAYGGFNFEIWDPQPHPTAAPGAIGGLLTAPTTANVGLADLARILGTVVTTPATAGILDVNLKNIANAVVSASAAQLGVNVVNLGNSVVDAASGLINANVKQISTDAVAADNAEAFFDGTGYAGTNNVIPTVTTTATATNVTTVNGLAANAITAASIATDAITAAKIAPDAIGASELAADAVTEIQNGLATPTNITAGTITTTTNLTNLPAITANWLTAAGIAAGALNGKGDWNIGKTGYALSAAGIQAIWDALTSALTTVGSIGKLLVDNIDATISSRSTYAGGDTSGITTLLSRIVGTLAAGTHNPQSGDAFSRIGVAGAGLTALGDTRIANLDSAVSTRSTLTAAGVWDALLTGITTVASIGKLIKDFLDVAVSSRLSTAGYTAPDNASITTILADTNDIQTRLPAALTGAGNIKADALVVSDKTGYTASTVSDKTGYSLSSAGIQAIWDALTTALTTIGSIGKLLVDNINATISSRATQTSLDTLDDFVDTEVAAIKTKTDQLTFTVANQVDSNSLSGSLNAAGVRSAIGLASANLDTQLDALPTNAELATALGTADDAVLAAIATVQADTDNIQTRLPAALVLGRIDASVGAMDVNTLTASALATDAVTEIQSGLATAAAIASLNNLSQANVRTAVGLASANLDTQLDTLPTATENATAVLSAATANPIDSNVQEINDTTLTGNGSTTPWGPV